MLCQGQETNRQLLLRLKDKDSQLFRLREKNKELARINTVQKGEGLYCKKGYRFSRSQPECH
jgi:hypothetical protein